MFDGQNLDAWTLRSPAAEGIWSVKNGVIDCNPVAGGRADKNLWSKQSFGDFTLRLEWRLKTPQGMAEIPTILPNGTYKLNQKGERVVTRMAVADSGVYVRGLLCYAAEVAIVLVAYFKVWRDDGEEGAR